MQKVSYIPLENILADDPLPRMSKKGWIFDHRGSFQLTVFEQFILASTAHDRTALVRSVVKHNRQVEQKPGGRGREWATLGVHPLSWILSNNRLEKVPFVSVPHTSSNRLLLSNQDKGCTPSVAHSLPLPLGPALLNLWTVAAKHGSSKPLTSNELWLLLRIRNTRILASIPGAFWDMCKSSIENNPSFPFLHIVAPIGPPTEVNCNDQVMTVYIPLDIIGDNEAEHLHWIDESCVGTHHNHTHVLISTPFNQCGTTMEVSELRV